LALKLNPESAECYFNLASAQFDKGALDQAKMNFMLAQEINQDNPETHYQLGLIAEREAQDAITNRQSQSLQDEHLQKAEKFFSRTLELDDKHQKAKEALRRVSK